MTDDLSTKALRSVGFAEVGSNVRISPLAQFFGVEQISIGSHVRIDAFAIITAGPKPVSIGSYCHVAAHTYVSGAQGGVRIGYGAGLAPYSALYTAVEDYTSGALTNPSVPIEFRQPSVGSIYLAPHVALGSSSVVLSGTTLGFGCSVGALSLVNRNVRAYEVVHGNPIRRVAKRNQSVLDEFDRDLRAKAKADGVDLEPLGPS